MFPYIYDLILLCLAVAALPKMVYMRIFHGKYSKSFLKRWGFGFPVIDKKDRFLIWIHAVSMGETKVAATLVKKIKEEMNDPLIVISSVTETGHQEALKAIPHADYKVYLPFDFSWIIKPIVRMVKPDLVLLCESDIWYNFLTAAKENKASIVVINGKISEKSVARHAKFPAVASHLFAPIDFFCVQSRHYEERFLKLGIPPSKITVTGNIKFDDAPSLISQPQTFKEQLGFKPEDLILVAGSTHDPEEKILLKALDTLWAKFPTLKAIIVPRHPERFKEAADLIEQNRIPYQRYTALDPQKEKKILLMDAMGLLRQCYQIASLAVVGGSFTEKVGGHNILEPSWYGVPVLFGPYMHQQPEMVEWIQEYQAGRQVSEATLKQELEDLLISPQKREILGQAGIKMMQEIQGATSKTWKIAKKTVPKKQLKQVS